MWICLNNAFFSIVAKGTKPNDLLVRARRKGDIEKVFAGAKVVEKRGTDYQFRAVVSRAKISEALALEVMGIEYDNFKNSVKDDDLHRAYAGFWTLHARMQPRAPYA